MSDNHTTTTSTSSKVTSLASATFTRNEENGTVQQVPDQIVSLGVQPQTWQYAPDPLSNNSDDPSSTFCLSFQATARRFSLCLSPLQPKFKFHSHLTIQFGNYSNTTLTMRRGKTASRHFPGRHTCNKVWVQYTIYQTPTRVIVQVGTDTSLQQLQSIGVMEHSSSGRPRNNNNKTTSNDTTAPVTKETADKTEEETPTTQPTSTRPSTPIYFGWRNHDPTVDLQIRNLQLSSPLTNDACWQALDVLQPSDLQVVLLGEQDETMALLQNYQSLCQAGRARAQKFGTGYQPPDFLQSLPWTTAKKLRTNQQSSSLVSSFQQQSNNNNNNNKNSHHIVTGIDFDIDVAKHQQRQERFGASMTDNNNNKETALDAVQALDKSMHADTAPLRLDPPSSLWNAPEREFVPTRATWTDKLHIYSMDWSFKQMRNRDILAYLSDYGAIDVEWLNDLSCNVLFCQDARLAVTRVWQALGMELPSDTATTTTKSLPDLGNRGWRLGKRILEKSSNDKYGKRGTTARLLMRRATTCDILRERPSSWPKPPRGFSTNRVLGPDFPRRKEAPQKKRGRPTTEELLNGGLIAGRGGFSVEQLQEERSRKRAKTTEESNKGK